jgi:putative tricarboxylic transport membrane protein
MRLQNICKGLGLAASALAVAAVSTPALAWEPEKSIEIVVAAGAGGASDQMARMLQAAIQKNNLVKQPVIVTLKGAASGAEALQYMKTAEGDPHKFVIAYSLIYTLPLAAKVPFDWRELTPVSIVAFDEFILWTKADAPYKSTKEFIEAAKSSSTPLTFGGTGSKREDQIIVSAMSQKTGAKFTYLPYKSGGEAATQLVGGHTTANVNNPSENSEVWRAGQVQALCVFSEKRIVYTDKVTDKQAWGDIPTCKEEGLDISYSMLRGIFLPGKVKDEQAKFYVDLFAKIAETTEYKEYMKKQALAPASLTGKEMISFLEKDEEMHKKVMTEAGFVASN